MKKLCLFLFTLSIGSINNAGNKTPLRNGSIINTDLNNVGLASDVICKLSQMQMPSGKKKYVINCVKNQKIVKRFDTVAMKESALTGTPGNITYKRYIGYINSKPTVEGLMGSGKRIDFFIPVAKTS